MRICNVTVHCTSTHFVLLDQVNYAFVSSLFELILMRVVCAVRGRVDAAASLQPTAAGFPPNAFFNWLVRQD
jgi:hypothetical protein